MINQKTKTNLFISTLFIAILLTLNFAFAAKLIDDWEYNPAKHNSFSSNTKKITIISSIVSATGILSFIGIGLYLILKKVNDEVNYKKRKLYGILLLVFPFAIFLITLLTAIIGMNILIFPVFIIILGFVIFGLVYSIKNKIYIGLIPPILFIIVMLGLIVISFFTVAMIGGSVTTLGSSSKGMSAQSIGGMNYAMDSASIGSVAESANIGFSVGGAKDIDNFRENIKSSYLPIPTDLTYEGLYYDYYFDTAQEDICEKLFCPSYSYALSKDPLSDEEEYYLQVGLNSGIKESDFQRKKLNLVVVLDISGSMGSPFNRYYYDQYGTGKSKLAEDDDDDYGEDYSKAKMEVATESIVALLDHLNPNDRFGMILFESEAYLGKELSLVSDTKMDAVKDHILDVTQTGGTNFEAGYERGVKLFDDYLKADSEEYENRIIFLTDAMPNTGSTNENGLLDMTKAASEKGIYSTFIGIGVDFNTELIEYITKIRGANYYSVHSSSEFKTRMDDEFEYMVTPLVFNLLLKLESSDFEIEKVYGSPEANEATGEIMKVNTLFPSSTDSGQSKGGIVILKLNKIGDGFDLNLFTSYEDRSGKTGGDESNITFDEVTADHYDNNGIRKGILLARYVNLMKNWVIDERSALAENEVNPIVIEPRINYEDGLCLPPVLYELGKWERQSVDLVISEDYKKYIADFKEYYDSEMNEISDETLNQESELMELLIE